MRAPGLLLSFLLAGGAAAAAADATQLRRGEEIYGRCAGCHAIEQHRTGPAHCGLFGRKAGSAPGYDRYSPALRGSGIVWDERTLSRFLADPMAAVPGTTMTYQGVADPAERQALVAWLKQATRPGQACRMPG